ncbi:hypothetical protein SFUMM280S_02236 [Streptomyces fumanus]
MRHSASTARPALAAARSRSSAARLIRRVESATCRPRPLRLDEHPYGEHPENGETQKPHGNREHRPEHGHEPRPSGAPAVHRCYAVECSRRVRTPPPVSSSTIRSPAGLRTVVRQSGQVNE